MMVKSAAVAALFLAVCDRSDALIFLESADPTHNTTTPGDNSGWQYEGKFLTNLGVPIAPHFFITANHIGGSVGDTFNLHGDIYTTIAFQDIPDTDLRVWEVNHAKPFPVYAPISGHEEISYTYQNVPATIIGRGTQRGASVQVSSVLKGWQWGGADQVQRWGKNVIVDTLFFSGSGYMIYCDFNNPGVSNECHISTGDSGGGLFVQEDGLWKLAGINYAVDGPFRVPPAGNGFYGAVFDCGGLEFESGSSWVPIADTEADIPSSFYCSRVASSLPWLRTNVGSEVDSIAPENFGAWEKLYFTPTQLADAGVAGATVDPDADGVNNLLEFALNLDPIFNERVTMTGGTGLRGMPVSKIENVSGDRLTIEFVRRTNGSAAGLTYQAEFSSDLVVWEAAGTEIATSINSRWDRVKIADLETIAAESKRFVRLRVVLNE
jgi:hypothetical protein